MAPRFVRSTLLAAALVSLTPACGEKEVRPALDLLTASCAGTQPLAGVTHLRFRVTGPGIDTPRERVSTVEWAQEDVPALPPGSARVLEVRAYVGAPGQGGQLVSVGRTAPFDVAEGQAPKVRVFLRRLGEFVPVNLASDPRTCSLPAEARAAHTATTLPDGRVLITGGYLPEENGTRLVSGTTEVFDPADGTFSPGPDVGARAFHTASLLPDGRVFLAGGAESFAPVSLQSTARLVDVATGAVSELTPKVARYQHSAAVDAAGHVLLVGGRAAEGSGVFTAEAFDGASGRFVEVAGEVRRVDTTLTVMADGRTFLIAGGADTQGPVAEVVAVGFSGTDLERLTNVPPRLRVPRVGAAVAVLGRPDESPRPLLMGGFDDVDPTLDARAVGASEVLEDVMAVSDGPALMPRSNPCAVSLADGRVVALGGRGTGIGTTYAVPWAELITPYAGAQATVLGLTLMPQPRVWHTCSALPDGSVLVVGGVDDSTGEPRANTEALVVMPQPRD
ncbi:branched-chain amino acid ABC transporter2C amino acid-binding protein [Corallococcus coralloides]|uniref:Branched-chain amino acid ABC transporter2C amino acid-binding protein n=1 Tax=Corallococcus coralloides TaxID=184914 RepID=A0A410RPM2_CORCK|nr:kelch repeat-containing protein [Corallococcus coralloides]QAT83917.1 branched-chain amino acid ABC transporter2C amino acid-binding protein [Corallococcus coralloides]